MKNGTGKNIGFPEQCAVCQNLLWEQNIASYFVRGFQGDDYVFQSDLNFANLKHHVYQIILLIFKVKKKIRMLQAGSAKIEI